MKKPKQPPVPSEWEDTIRHEIISVLEGQALSAKEISGLVGIREKEVYDHLEHIRQSLQRHERQLIVTPAACEDCGFVFRKRERLTRPGRCPVCKGEEITEPLFEVMEKSI
jgi:hypothetical protein